MLGLEVDSFEHKALNFDGMVVGQVTQKNRHQNSNKLWVCEVDIGSRRLSVVCGAPNVEVGQKVAVAPEKSRLPDGTTIQHTEIRGVTSEGMICSELELGISSRGDGIMVLDEQSQQGKKLSEVLGQGEIIIDVDVTPNRPDCFGVIGIAREIATMSDSELRKPKISIRENNQDINELIKIKILDPDKCPRYSARFIGDVEIKPSPWWLAQRLEAVGVRAINNVVDVTNYVMLETGQPLHAFDYQLLKGQQINVKTASEGENFTTLDDKTHVLNSKSLMICDGERAVAVGGIMGGLNSEVSSETKNVLLESAYFNPVNIRRTSKFLGISSESSKRFERGTDPNGIIYALNRATQLIAELTDGKIANGYVDVYPKQIKPKKIALRPKRIQLLLGKKIPKDRIKSILTSLNFKLSEKKGQDFEVEVPTFRPDVTREADLIEEVARVYGYDNIEPDSSARIEQLTPRDTTEVNSKRIANHLISSGLSEVVTYCLVHTGRAKMFTNDESDLIPVTNPISEELSHLRPSLIPGLLNVVRWNINRRNPDLKLFEMGTVFHTNKSKVVEDTHLTAVFTGKSRQENWKEKSEAVDIHDVKGMAESLLSRHCQLTWQLTSHTSDVTTTKTLGIQVDNRLQGFIGELKRGILEEFEIQQPVFVFELNLLKLIEAFDIERGFTAIPKFPPIQRDIAIIVKEEIASADIQKQIEQNGGENLRKVALFDVFSGKQVSEGHKSLAYNLTFYSLERTLTEEEIDSQMKVILDSLERKFGARLRD